MTQHEYVFVAVSIILGLAITRLLHTVAMLIRAKSRGTFHWSSAVYSLCVMSYILQLWWIGWGLREIEVWAFSDFLVLVAGSICIYGAAELALPVPEEDDLDMLAHSQSLGRLSALSMLVYFAIGPYFNLAISDTAFLPSLIVPAIGVLLMATMIVRPGFFKGASLLLSVYSLSILVLTT